MVIEKMRDMEEIKEGKKERLARFEKKEGKMRSETGKERT